MLVSAVSSNCCQAVFNTGINAKGTEYYVDTAFNSLNSRKLISDKQNKLFDSINEWKCFCHNQIEKGKLDIIA